MSETIYRRTRRPAAGQPRIEYVPAAVFHGRIPEPKGDIVKVPLLSKTSASPQIEEISAAKSEVLHLELRIMPVVGHYGEVHSFLAVPEGYEFPDHPTIDVLNAGKPADPSDQRAINHQ